MPAVTCHKRSRVISLVTPGVVASAGKSGVRRRGRLGASRSWCRGCEMMARAARDAELPWDKSPFISLAARPAQPWPGPEPPVVPGPDPHAPAQARCRAPAGQDFLGQALHRGVCAGGDPADRSHTLATRFDSSVPLNFAAHSPEDRQHDRSHRSARLERIGPKRLFQYRTAARRALSQSPPATQRHTTDGAPSPG
jgi:hypothetical protein